MLSFLNGFFFLLFFAAMVLNHNDPDPQIWMAVYGSAAIFCAWFHKKKRVPVFLAAVFVLGCAAASVSIGLAVDTSRPLFAQEFFNESAGLLLCTLWIGALLRKTWKVRQFMFITS